MIIFYYLEEITAFYCAFVSFSKQENDSTLSSCLMFSFAS